MVTHRIAAEKSMSIEDSSNGGNNKASPFGNATPISSVFGRKSKKS